MAIDHTLYLQEFYGVTSDIASVTPPDVERAYAAALLIVAAPDGLSDEERAYFEAWERACGHGADLIEEFRGFDPTTADSDSVLQVLSAKADETSETAPGPPAGLKRALVYDAIKVASSDGGYSDSEKARMREVAAIIGVDADMVTALEGLVATEAAVRGARLALFQ